MIAASWNRAKFSLGVTGWNLPFLDIHAPKSMKIMKIYENQSESEENNENRMIAASWNRVNLSLRVTGWNLPFLGIHAPKSMNIIKIYKNHNQNLRKSMKIDNSSQLESSKAFSRGHRLELTVLRHPCSEIHENLENL